LDCEALLLDTLADFEGMGFDAEKAIEVLNTTVAGLEYLKEKKDETVPGPSDRLD